MKLITTPYIYKSVARCIYCGATNLLSDEHIIPASLGGDIVFEKASCSACAEITRAFERECAIVYGPLRIAYDFGNQPPDLPVILEYPDGRREVARLPVTECPAIPVLSPILPVPGILVNRPQSEHVAYNEMQYTLPTPFDQEARLRKLKEKGVKIAGVQSYFGLNAFMRLFAKIGHGVAVARYGINAFNPILPDYILGRNACLSHVVGCSSSPTDMILPENPDLKNRVHAFQIGIFSVGDTHYVLIRIQLFRPSEFPIYEVIAGIASEELVQRDVGNPEYPAIDISLLN